MYFVRCPSESWELIERFPWHLICDLCNVRITTFRKLVLCCEVKHTLALKQATIWYIKIHKSGMITNGYIWPKISLNRSTVFQDHEKQLSPSLSSEDAVLCLDYWQWNIAFIMTFIFTYHCMSKTCPSGFVYVKCPSESWGGCPFCRRNRAKWFIDISAASKMWFVLKVWIIWWS